MIILPFILPTFEALILTVWRERSILESRKRGHYFRLVGPKEIRSAIEQYCKTDVMKIPTCMHIIAMQIMITCRYAHLPHRSNR